MTALHKSYWVENGDVFKLLLERGADPDIKDNDNDTNSVCSSLSTGFPASQANQGRRSLVMEVGS